MTSRDRSACRVTFQPLGKRAEVQRGTTLAAAARGAGIPLAADCDGLGTCGQCRVVVTAGPAADPTAAEVSMTERGTLALGQRLACQLEVRGDLTIEIPSSSLFTDQRLQTWGASRPEALDPAVCCWELEVSPPSLADSRADMERVLDELERRGAPPRAEAGLAALRQLSDLARRTDWRFHTYLRGTEIVGFSAPDRGPVGFAADLGTTKVAGYLVDLRTGEELAAAGTVNPQIAFGEDVVSRLARAKRSAESAREIAAVLREAVNELAGHLAEQAGVGREQLVDACVVGNTAIIHLYLELPVGPLAVAPFVAATSRAIDFRAREVGLELAPGAFVHVPSGAGGFVGADHVAMIVGSGIDRDGATRVGIDIGTNTEIVVSRPGTGLLLAASCASGPAFEGAHIRDGMRAAPGAIEAVKLTPQGPLLKTIGGAPPVGLCGSGIVDAVAELWRSGAIDGRGRLLPGAPGVRTGRQGNEFVLAAGDESGSGRDVVVTQMDISEIQLAKGAIFAGVETLLEAAEVAFDQVDEVLVAGAFGSYLDLDNARTIGLLPRLPKAGYRQVGNAAGDGAKRILVSVAERRRAEAVGACLRHIELNKQPGFSRRLARAMGFSNP